MVLHERATAAIESLNELIAAFDQPGWEWPGPLALDLLRSQIDLFALSVLLDHWFDDAGGTLDGAGLWTLPPDAPLAPVLGARNAVIHFEAVVLPAVLSEPTLDAARARFFELDGCAIAEALATGIAGLAGGES